MPSASETDHERRRRPTADARADARSRSREPASSSSSSDRSKSRDDRHRSHSREPEASSSSHRSESRDRDRDRAASRDRPHRSPSREKHGASSGGAAASSNSRKRPHVRYAAPSDAPTLAASASRSGFLRKQADNDPGSWHRYFFAIKASTLLYYFNSATDETPRGVIDLEFLADVKRNGDCLQRAVGGGEHCFRLAGKLPPGVREKMRPLYLDAESAEDARAWMDALRTHRFSLDGYEQSARNEEELDAAKRALAQLETQQAQQQAAAHATSAVADRVLARLRRLALSNQEVSEETSVAEPVAASSSNGGSSSEGDKVDLLASLQAMESVVNELQLKLAAQQQAIGALREQAAEHERKQRDKALQFVAATFKKKAAATRQKRSMTTALKQTPDSRPAAESEDEDEAVPSSASSSLTSALEDPSAAVGRPKSASNTLGLFARAKTKARGAKPQPRGEDSPDSSTLGSCVEEAERPKASSKLPIRLRRNTSLDAAPAVGLVGAFKKRVAKASALNDSSSSGAFSSGASNPRGSEEDATSTDERSSEEAAGKAPPSKATIGSKANNGSKGSGSKAEGLPAGWKKHESRSNPGQFFYAHVSGATSWVVPKGQPRGEPEPEGAALDADDSEAEDDGHASTASSAAASSPAKTATTKKKKGWAFKLPRKLTIASATPAASPPSASTSPIQHDESHHEF